MLIELENYLTDVIRGYYRSFDGGHDERHFDEVYKAAEILSQEIFDKENQQCIIATAAAFHDTGRIIDHNDHEIYSIKILRNDNKIKTLLSKEDIQIVCQVILEHRSRCKSSNIYSDILKDADSVHFANKERYYYRVVAYNTDKMYQKYQNDINVFYNETITRIADTLTQLSNGNHAKSIWRCPVSNKLFGEKEPFDVPDNIEIKNMIDNYLKEKYY